MTQEPHADSQQPGSALSVVVSTPTGAAVSTPGADSDAQPSGPASTSDSEDIVTVLYRARREAERSVGACRDYTSDEVAARGDAIYRDQILPEIEPPPKGTFVVIDIESGDYEIDERDLTATLKLLKRRPAAMTYAVRVGYRAPYRHTGSLLISAQRA